MGPASPHRGHRLNGSNVAESGNGRVPRRQVHEGPEIVECGPHRQGWLLTLKASQSFIYTAPAAFSTIRCVQSCAKVDPDPKPKVS